MNKIDRIAEALEDKLPELAKDIIQKSQRLPEQHKQAFLQDPDAVKQHHPKWHQWGIITHTKKFREMYEGEAQQLLQEWGLEKQVDRYLGEEIDGIPKAELLKMAIPVHDLGKFDKVLDGDEYDYKGHEKRSKYEALHGKAGELLQSYGLKPAHIEYIAECAGKHFELGILRRDAKKTKLGYTMEYAKSEQLKKDVKERLPGFKGLEVEIGLLFLADSLAKTDVRAYGNAELEIEQRGLDKRILGAAVQMPVQMEVAKQYLQLVLRE